MDHHTCHVACVACRTYLADTVQQCIQLCDATQQTPDGIRDLLSGISQFLSPEVDCPKCGKRCSSETSLKNHWRTHIDCCVPCDYCSHTSYSTSRALTHYKECKTRNGAPFTESEKTKRRALYSRASDELDSFSEMLENRRKRKRKKTQPTTNDRNIEAVTLTIPNIIPNTSNHARTSQPSAIHETNTPPDTAPYEFQAPILNISSCDGTSSSYTDVEIPQPPHDQETNTPPDTAPYEFQAPILNIFSCDGTSSFYTNIKTLQPFHHQEAAVGSNSTYPIPLPYTALGSGSDNSFDGAPLTTAAKDAGLGWG